MASAAAAASVGNENISFINSQIRQRLNSSLQLNDSGTPPSVRTGKRGRPPGSLNKPKDPNSPKKQPKSLTKKIIYEILNFFIKNNECINNAKDDKVVGVNLGEQNLIFNNTGSNIVMPKNCLTINQ